MLLAGTPVQVADINPGTSDSYPRYLTAVGDTLFFEASDNASGQELWASDGTANGTRQVADINPGTSGSSPRYLTAVGDTLFFTAFDAAGGRELWAVLPNEAPTAITLSNNTVAENAGEGDVVGTLSTTDEDLPGDSFTYTLTDPSGNFEIVDDELRVAAGASLDFEDIPSYSVMVTSTDSGTPSLSFEETFTITVLDVNEAPTAEAGGPYSVNPSGTVTLDASGSSDPDADEILTYAFDLDGDGTFEFLSTSPTLELTPIIRTQFGIDAGTNTVTLQVTDADGLSSTDTADVTVVPAVVVSVSDAMVTEGAGAMLVFTVTLDAAAAGDVTVDYFTGSGSALSGVDFAPTSGTLTFAAGETSKTVIVSVADDLVVERDEIMRLFATGGVSAEGRDVTLAPAFGTGTIVDADAATVSIAPTGVVEGADGSTTTLDFTVTLSAPASGPVRVLYTVAGGGTARNGVDYVFVRDAVTFAAGETSKTVSVVVNGDDLVELDETVKVQLLPTVASGGRNVSVGGATEAFGTITNDDAAVLSVDDATVVEGAPGAAPRLAFVVNLDHAVDVPVTFTYQTSDGTGTLADADYRARTGTFTISAGQTSATVLVAVRGDDRVEGDETVGLTLTSVTANGRSVNLGDDSAIGTITNDDSALLSVDDTSVLEGAAGESPRLNFTVRLDHAVDVPVTFTYETADGTATLADNDYRERTGTITIPAGQTERVVAVAVRGDGTVEGDENVRLMLTSVTAAGRDVTLGDASAFGTITNDDAAVLTIDDAMVVEGTPNPSATPHTRLEFTVRLDRAVNSAVSISYTTADGSATAGVDYFSRTGTLTIPAGQTTGTIVILVRRDAVAELDETVQVLLSDLQAGTRDVTLGDAQAFGTILDDDGMSALFAGGMADEVLV